MPLRVAIDATPLLGARTGVGTFVAGALPALAAEREAVELTAYALSWNGRRELAGLLPPGAATVRVPMAAGPLLRMWSRTSGPAAEWWTGAVDVVHGTNFVVPPGRHAAEVVTVHDLTAVRFPQMCTPASLAYPTLVRRALARGAWVHTPSQFVAGEVVDLLGADPARVRAVPHGAPSPTPTAGPRQDQDRYILSVSTAEPRKDLPGLVRAFAAVVTVHPDVRLVLLGQRGWGEDALTAAIDATAPAARARISRLGYLDDARRTALIGGAAVLAYPSVYEGFGLPPLEAMAAGVPVVATRAGAVPEVVGDAARLVDVGDTDALAGALVAALDEGGAERAITADRGRAHAATFTWERCAKGLLGIYVDATLRASRR